MAVDHAARGQILVGSLDSEENNHEAGGQQLPEEQNDPENNVGLTTDLLYVCLIGDAVPAITEGAGSVLW